MKRSCAILLTICLPILLGAGFYYLHTANPLFTIVRNYLPDGLWAFSLTSILWMIWDGAISKVWIATLCLLYIFFELLQYMHLIGGTGDVMDIIAYFAFTFLSLTINKKISKTTSV